jgi:subtilase family serine protease
MVRTDVSPGARPAVLSDELQNCRQEFQEGYCPIDLQQAYDLPSLSEGDHRLVAIVDAFGYKNAASDLATYRQTMGLKACSEGTKCLRIVNQNGKSSPLPPQPPPSDDWKGEESLDLDMVSAICPNCKIVLVQTDNDDVDNLYAGIKTAGRLNARYIGASWGIAEFGGDNSTFHQHGRVIAVAAGDDGGGGRYGGGPTQPCTYTYVVCVGGTHLVRANNARGWSETVWNDWTFDECGSGNSPCGATGSGCSKRIAKPPWQTGMSCSRRSESDVSATASLQAPVIVYNSEEGGGTCPQYCFWLYGGTSASTQIIAAVFALAGNAESQVGAKGIWKHHSGNTYGVTHGNNVDAALGVTCASSIKYICYARRGWDGPTGWGTPNDLGAF